MESVGTAPSVNIFKKRLEKVFPYLPHLLNTYFLNPLTPPPPAYYNQKVECPLKATPNFLRFKLSKMIPVEFVSSFLTYETRLRFCLSIRKTTDGLHAWLDKLAEFVNSATGQQDSLFPSFFSNAAVRLHYRLEVKAKS